MSGKSFDVLVAKDFEANVDGKPQKRTAWNRVGRAWRGKKPETFSFELFLFPGQKYVLHLGDRTFQRPTPFENFDQVGGNNENV